MMNAIDTLKLANRNTASRWSFGVEEKDTDPDLAVNRVHQGFFVPKFNPKFKLSGDSSFFTIGSCFAREIETVLIRRGYNVTSRIKEIEDNPLFPVRRGVTTIHDFFNRYNVPAIASELISVSRGRREPQDHLIYEVGDGVFDDLHYTGALESASREIVLERRELVSAYMAQAYKKADVIIITLGLSEAWFDSQIGSYLNVVSSPQMLKRYSDRLGIRVIQFSEAMWRLLEAIRILDADGKKIILTVSPVPLQVTFQDADIVVANSAAKAILRALCAEISSLFETVDYFPSFEMVSYSDPRLAWKPDGRHVQLPMVEEIMKLAMSSYLGS